MNNFIQVAILGLSGLAIWLATGNSSREKKAGAAVGVVAQVFWIIETYNSNQWGMLLLSGWYMVIFLRILINEGNATEDRTTNHTGPK